VADVDAHRNTEVRVVGRTEALYKDKKQGVHTRTLKKTVLERGSIRSHTNGAWWGGEDQDKTRQCGMGEREKVGVDKTDRKKKLKGHIYGNEKTETKRQILSTQTMRSIERK